MAEVIAGIAAASSIIQLLDNALRITISIGRFYLDFAGADDITDDIFAKLRTLGESLEAISLTLARRRNQLETTTYVHEEECQILEMAIRNLQDCAKTKEMLENNLEILNQRDRNSTLAKVQMRLRIGFGSGSLERFDKRIQANYGSLNIILSCLNLFAMNQINADTTLLISTISEGSSRQQRFIEMISENLVGRQLSLHEISHDDYGDSLDDVETMSYNITGEKYVKTNMRTSARTIQAANRLVLIESSQGSDGPSQGSLESISEPPDSPENVAPGQQRRSSESMQHYRTMLLNEYTGHAKACFGNGNYDSSLNGIERAMEQGELRYKEHKIPFDTYLELELLRIEVYQQQSQFSHGERLLSGLIYKVEQAQSREVNKYQITSEGRGKLYLAMAQLHLKRYRETGDRALLSGVLETAKKAYEFSITEQEHNPEEFGLTELNTRSASSLIKAAELNGDHVLADVIRSSHPTLVEPNKPQLDEAMHNESSVQNILISLIDSGNLELARYFAQIRRQGGSLGEILEVVDSSGLTPLLLAARNRNYPIFKFLLENGANIAATDCRNLGVLHYALISGDGVELVQMLGLIAAHKEIDLNVIEAGHTALTYCAKMGYYDAAKALLEVGLARPQKPINLEKMNSHGETAAFIASRRVDVRMMKLLYSKGAKFNRRNMDKRARAIIQGWAKG